MTSIPRLLLTVLLLAGLLLSAAPQVTAQTAETPHIPTERLAGPNRFATAAAVAAATFPAADTVYVAPGGDFPAALAGGPRAARDGAPLLLVEADRLPAETSWQLDRLDPSEIVVLGNATDVSEAVTTALAAHGSVRRIAGADAIATVAEIALDGWGASGADIVYLATAADFPDALAGGVAGALRDGPVLLVHPNGVPAVTAAAIQQIDPDALALLGGTAAISDVVLTELLPLTDAVISRLAGPTRIETALEISEATHHDGLDIDTVYLATAGNFPDAMASASAIAATGGALLLTHQHCLPYLVRNEIARLAPQRLLVLGGTAAISEDAAQLATCEQLPPAPEITVEAAPVTDSLEEIGGSGPRPVAELHSDSGNRTRFVADELIVSTEDMDALDALLGQVGGRVIRTVPPFGDRPTTHVVKVTEAPQAFAQVSVTTLGSSMQWLNGVATGVHAVTSQTGFTTMMAATAARTSGLSVGLNFVSEPHGLIDRDITESLQVDANNPFDWPQFRVSGEPAIGTAEAWRLLRIAGRNDATATIGIIDGGFAMTNGDYPPGVTGNTGQPNPIACATNPCPWHGTDVAIAAGGVMDNSFGSVGSAGPVGRLRLYTHSGGVDSMIARIQQAVADGVDVINMSFGGEVDAVATIFIDEGEDATEAAFSAGVFVVASAGNDGRDIDAEDCFVVWPCWEEEWIWPCENNGVYCVGGLAPSSTDRDPDSNFGRESCDNPNCQVDIFAPFTIFVGERPSSPGDQLSTATGTSLAAPNIAGIAGLVLAANPTLPPLALEYVLDVSAQGSPDPTVGRVVNAHGAVLGVLGDVPPLLEITSPTDGSSFFYNSIAGPEVEAVVATISDEPATVEWQLTRLSTNQTTSVNPTQTLHLPGPGDYLLRATATVDGHSTTDEVTITATNQPPQAEIISPSQGETVTQGQLTAVNGLGTDANQPGGIPCHAYEWAIDGQVMANACSPTIAFNDTGAHTLTLTVTDDYGLTDSDMVVVTVQEPPNTGPPSVSITAPVEGQALGGGQFTQLQGVASDPDGDPISYQWTVSGNFPMATIGSTLNMSWRPDDDVPFNCGGQQVTVRLTATAAGESSSDEVSVYIVQPPC